ncbi:MAG: cytochrome c-type biogenesis protein CcmH [Paraglaciecola sp.]|jgi:cytochrome c-type biogenesis protein CcmH
MKLLLWLVAACWALLSLGAVATEETYHFDDPGKRALFFTLTQELRCPKCQNQNIADSDAMIAGDLKRKVYQLVQQGQSRDDVIDYMKQRYGDFVYYQPPVNSMTMWLWLLPLFFVLGGIIFVVLGRQTKPQVTDNVKLAQANKLLEDDK